MTCSSSLSCSSIKERVTFSCSIIISIVLFKSTSILTTFAIDVSPNSTLACTYSSFISLKANAPTFSTLICTYCCISHPSKFLSFMTPPMPSIDSTEACCSSPPILVFFRVCIYQRCKNHKTNKNHHQLFIWTFFTNTRKLKTPTSIVTTTKHHSLEAIIVVVVSLHTTTN